MFFIKLFGFVLSLAIVVFGVFLYHGATKIENMILTENEQKGDE